MNNTHGGARRNAGRKTELVTEKMVRVTITIDPMTERKLRVIGSGNRARGVRLAADLAFAKLQG